MKLPYLIKYLFLLPIVFHTERVFAQCDAAPTCESLGYKMTEAQCNGKKALKCPMDLTKVFCGGGIVGEVKPFGGKELPKGWLKADGSSVSSSKYPELYAAIGNTYGGSGSTFKLPDLAGKMVWGASTSSYVTNKLGSTGGAATVTLTIAEMPSHAHGWTGVNGTGWPKKPSDSGTEGTSRAYPRTSQTAYRGSGWSHNNMPPYLAVNYIIFSGVFEGDEQ